MDDARIVRGGKRLGDVGRDRERPRFLEDLATGLGEILDERRRGDARLRVQRERGIVDDVNDPELALERLGELGVSYAQGFFVAVPQSVAELPIRSSRNRIRA